MRITPVADPAFLALGGAVLLALVVIGAITDRRARRAPWLLRGLVVLTLLVLTLRPGWGTERVPAPPFNLEVLVVADRTASMSAVDGAGGRSRLEAARADAAALVDLLPEARVSVASVGSVAATELPSTQDGRLVEEALADLATEGPALGDGSRIDRTLPTLTDWLERLDADFPERHRVVVLMSDGEQTSPGGLATFAALRPLVDDGLVLGYGSAEGATIPDPDDPDDPARPFLDPRTGQPAHTRIDETSLRLIADQLGLPFVHRTAEGVDGLRPPAASWAAAADVGTPAPGQETPVDHELTWLVALLLLGLATIELRGDWRRAGDALGELR